MPWVHWPPPLPLVYLMLVTVLFLVYLFQMGAVITVRPVIRHPTHVTSTDIPPAADLEPYINDTYFDTTDLSATTLDDLNSDDDAASQSTGVGRVWMLPLNQIGNGHMNTEVPTPKPSVDPPPDCSSTVLRPPNSEAIRWNATYYQELPTEVGTVFLWNAYYDTRDTLPSHPYVRVLGMLRTRSQQDQSFWCYLWYSAQAEPVVVKASARLLWFKYRKKKRKYKRRWYYPFMYSCLVSSRTHGSASGVPPTSVTISTSECTNADNLIPVVYNNMQPSSKPASYPYQFGVCLKGLNLYGMDNSRQLVEWLEMYFIFGVDKVFVYKYNSNKNVNKVLDYYGNVTKQIEVIPRTLPGSLPNASPRQQHDFIANTNNKSQKRFNEMLTYNDCLYRNMHNYEFLLLVDFDEVIVPTQHKTYAELMKHLAKSAENFNSTASFPVLNFYFMDAFQTAGRWPMFPPYSRLLQHTRRSRTHNPKGDAVKSFHRTSAVVTAHNHLPLNIFPNFRKYHTINFHDARMHHYKSSQCGISDGQGPCQRKYRNITIDDRTLHTYAKPLLERTTTALQNIFPNEKDSVHSDEPKKRL